MSSLHNSSSVILANGHDPWVTTKHESLPDLAIVIPAQAGIQDLCTFLDPGLRRGNEVEDYAKVSLWSFPKGNRLWITKRL